MLPLALHPADYQARLEDLTQRNYQRLKKGLQPDSTPGSEPVDSVDTTAAVSAPDVSTSGALASGAAGTGPVLETSRQSYPTLQTIPNDSKAERLYAWDDLPNSDPSLSSLGQEGGVPNHRSFPLYAPPTPILYQKPSHASNPGNVLPGFDSLRPLFPDELDQYDQPESI